MVSFIIAIFLSLIAGFLIGKFSGYTVGEVAIITIGIIVINLFLALVIGNAVNQTVIDYVDYDVYYRDNVPYYVKDGKIKKIDSVITVKADENIYSPKVRIEEYDATYWVRSSSVKLVLPAENY